MTFVNELVKTAIQNLKTIDSKYFESTLSQRLSNNGAGSIVDGINSVEEIEGLLMNSNWEHYKHPSIMEGCFGYKSDITGQMGIVDLSEVPSDFEGTLDDRKGTGKASFCLTGINRIPIDYTVLIVGPEKFEGEDVEIMYTFHPGDPISPSTLNSEMCYHFGEAFPMLDGKKITVKEALKMELKYGKIV